MEQRRENRLKANTPVTVTVLGILGDPSSSATVVDMSGSGLRLSLALPLPCGAAVKVEAEEMLMLGEVVRCEPDESGGYAIGVHLSHSLAPLTELSRLNRALLGEDFRVLEHALAPIPVRRKR